VFADRASYLGDPDFVKVPVAALIAPDYAARRAREIDPARPSPTASVTPGLEKPQTTHFSVVDRWGNACSFICSNYMGIGSGLVAGDTGIALQNRGALFDLDPRHRNVIAPGKRPYHTIIPAMALPLAADKPYRVVSFGVMGGFMQPQGHVQVLLNLLVFGMDLQEALDMARFRHLAGSKVALEGPIPEPVRAKLREMGHEVVDLPPGDAGGGQAIIRLTRGYAAGSDPRKDGMAAGH